MRCSLAESATKTKLADGAIALSAVAPSLVSEDIEGIHRARVASRRLRAVIEAHRSAIGSRERKRLMKAVRRITSDLGVARELDVTIQLLERRRMGLSGAERYACTYIVTRLRALRVEEGGAIAASAAYITSDAFRARLSDAVSSARAPKGCYLAEAEGELKDCRKALWRAHAEWAESQTEESLHAVRIAFKKFRYGCEQYSDLYGKQMKRFVKSLRAVQDDLGIWNDYRVARRYVNALAEGAEPMAASGVAPLAELLGQEAERHLHTYRTIATEFFSAKQRKKVKQLVADVKAPCCAKRKKR